MSVKGSNDSTELYRSCKETDDSALNKLLKNYRDLSRKLNGCPFAHTIDEAITLMEKWLMERDHQKFFQTIIDSRADASKLFDQCKSINTFHGDHFENYEKIRKFIDDNRDNFGFLSSELQPSVEAIRGINKDEEPWNKMPTYMKLMRNLNGQLQDRKSVLVEDIKKKYNEIFDELDKYASSVGVSQDNYAKRDVTISLMTNTNNFYALQVNAKAKAAEFYEEQMRKINAAIPSAPASSMTQSGTATSAHDDGLTDTPKPKPRIRKVVHLSTHTTEPMHTEADIDLYLQSLKAQLMQYLGEDNDIIVS